jgi:hypothetical protein
MLPATLRPTVAVSLAASVTVTVAGTAAGANAHVAALATVGSVSAPLKSTAVSASRLRHPAENLLDTVIPSFLVSPEKANRQPQKANRQPHNKDPFADCVT